MIIQNSSIHLFSITNSDNQLLGQVRGTGKYLRENGSVGTRQQIDLAV